MRKQNLKLVPYRGRSARPIKLRLKTRFAAEEILARNYRDIEEYKIVFIKKSKN